MDLILPLKRKWFEQIKSGVKHFEYRLYNEYWKKRLVNRKYENIVFTLGYPERDDKSRRIVKPFAGYKIQEIIHEEWGNKQKKVFAIKIV